MRMQLRGYKRALGGTTAFCLAAALLMSCGGQTSSNPTGNEAASNNGGSGSVGSGTNTANVSLVGAFQASLYDSDFVGFLTPSPESGFYGLYYLQTNGKLSIYPDIYRGLVSGVTNSSASVNSMSVFQFSTHMVNGSPTHLSTGSASISGSSAANYQISLSGITLNNNQTNPNFSANAMTSYAGLQGSWTGTLTDNDISASAGLTLTFDASGALSGSISYAHCPLTLSLTPAQASGDTPYYAAHLEIAPTTGCKRSEGNNNQTTVLSGIGFIHASPVSGRSKRLEIILTDSTGSGISFRGDQ